jgi:mobilization protein NikA
MATRKKKDDLHSKVLFVRLTEDELKALRERAKRAHVNLATFVRLKLFPMKE